MLIVRAESSFLANWSGCAKLKLDYYRAVRFVKQGQPDSYLEGLEVSDMEQIHSCGIESCTTYNNFNVEKDQNLVMTLLVSMLFQYSALRFWHVFS